MNIFLEWGKFVKVIQEHCYNEQAREVTNLFTQTMKTEIGGKSV